MLTVRISLFKILILMTILVCSSTTLISCMVMNNDIRLIPAFGSVDPKLEKYVASYESHFTEEMRKRFARYKLTMGFEFEHGDVVGQCFYMQPGVVEVGINERSWKYESESERENLVFHELTHCLCGRDHDHHFGKYRDRHHLYNLELIKENGLMADGCPTSIMYPIILPYDCYDVHHAHYMKEMTERCDP